MENAGSDRCSSIPVADGKGIRIAVQACMGSGQGYCELSHVFLCWCRLNNRAFVFRGPAATKTRTAWIPL